MIRTHTRRMVDVPVRGGCLRVAIVEAEGSAPDAELPTVLAIDGVTSSHLAWAYLANELRDVRIIAPDLRGRGGSNSLPGPAGMETHATDLIAVLDALNIASLPVTTILGPTAARLSLTFESADAYLEFWKQHPAFPEWNATLDEYFAYPLTVFAPH